MRVLVVVLAVHSIAEATMNTNPGINYTGRIMKADGSSPVTSANVTFSVAIYDINHNCLLYTESRTVDLSTTAGTFSFDIGDGAATTSSFNGNVSNIYDLFNNNKAFTGLTCTAPHTGFTAAAANEPRIMMVSFDAGDGSGSQNLPPLKLNPVPAALQAYKLNGYGTGDLLRVDSSVDKTANSNTDLTQTQYDEFWRLVKNPNTAYLSSSSSLAGDVTGPFATNTVVKIQGVAVSGAAPTNGQILMYSGGAWTPTTPAPSGVASVTASLPLSVSGSSTANISMSQADTTHDGYLAQGDWNTFNNKQSSTLANGKIWVGNSGNVATEVTMSGDVSIDNAGAASLATTGVAAGTYSKVTVDTKGRVTVGASLGSADIISMLGYTPVNKAGDVMAGNLSLQSVTSDPVGLLAADEGKMWYRSDLNTVRYWDGASAISLGVAGAGMQSLNGLTTTAQSFVTGTAGADFNISSSGSDHTFNIPTASATNRGALSPTDWATFNAKMGTTLANGKVWMGNASGAAVEVSISGDASVDNTGALAIGAGKITAPMLSTGGINAATSGVVIAGTTGNLVNFGCATSGHVLKWSVTGWTCAFPDASLPTLTNGKIWIGNASNVAVETDVTSALGYTPVNKAGDTMGGALAMGAFDITNTGNITMAANKYFGLSANSTNGSVAGQMWYDSGTIKYYDGSVVKSLGVAGSGITNINGLTAGTQSFVVGTAGTDIAISSSGSAHTFDIPTASASNRGALSSADWTTFNSKQTNSLASAKVWVGNASGGAAPVSMSGDATMDNAGAVTLASSGVTAGTYSKVTVDAKGRVTAGSNLTASDLPALASAKVWVGNASGAADPVSISGDATLSNTGAVTLASSGVTAGTYSKVTVDAKGRVTAGASLASSDVTSALTYTPVNKAGDTMGGALAMGANDITNTGNITMAANKYFSLSANSTNGTVAGQMWYDAGTIKYYDGGAVKSLGVAGAGITNINGLSTSTQSFVLGTAGTDIAISSSGSAHTFDIPTASASNRGALSSADWITFNSKQTNSLASAKIWVGNASGVATPVSMSGDATIDNAGALAIGAGKITGPMLSSGSPIIATTGVVTADATGNLGRFTCATSGHVATWSVTGWSCAAPAAVLPSLASTNLWVGNASGGPAAVAMSGDATMSNTGAVTLASSGVTAGTYSKVTVDTKGRVTAGASLASADITAALTYTPVNKAGDTMGGALAMGAFDITNTGNITMAANKYFSLSANSTNGTVAGQMWYDSGTIKYYDGSAVKSLGVAGAGITSLNGLSTGTQSFVLGSAGTDIAISSSGSAHTFDIPTASASNRGALSSADWTAFNSKQTNSLASAKIWVGNASGGAAPVSMSGDATMDNAGALAIGAAKITAPMLSSGGSIIATTGVVTADSSGNLGRFTCSTSGHVATWSVTGWSCAAPAAVLPSLASTNLWVGNASGGPAAVAMSGDATMSNTGAVTLASSGVTAGTYSKVTVDAKGRVTAGASLASADITAALTYTPVNKAGDTMGGALAMGANDITNTGNITMAANKYFSLSANSTNGSVAGQMWYDSGTIKYYDGSAVKSLGVAGAGITSLNGLSTGTQSFVLGTAGTDIAISSSGSAHTFDIPTASATKRGALSSADWATFNSKQTNSLASAKIWVGNASGGAAPVSMSGDATMDNAGAVTLASSGVTAGAYSKVTVDAKGRVTAGSNLTASDLPALASAKVWVGNASGAADPVSISGDATMSNTGAVTLASSGVTAGTYSKVTVDAKGRVTAGASLASTDITAALTYTPVNKAGDTMGGALAMGAFDITNTGNITMAANKYFSLSANSTNGSVAGQMWYDSGTIKYYDGSAVKSLGVAGAGITSLNGLSTATQTFGVGTTGTDFNIASSGSGHILHLPTASASNRGALSSADWTAFNSKQTNSLASAKIWVGNASGGAAPVSMSGDATMDNAGALAIGAAKITGPMLSSGGSIIATTGVVTADATGNLGRFTCSTSGHVATWSVTGWSCAAPAAVLPSLASTNLWVGNASGGPAAVAMSGDATMSNTGAVTLASSGVTAGTYTKVTVDAKGRVTAGAALASSDVTTALGFTPTSAGSGFVQNGNSFGATAVLGTNDANDLAFETNNVTKMTITSSGNVGIGNTSPSNKLDIQQNSNADLTGSLLNLYATKGSIFQIGANSNYAVTRYTGTGQDWLTGQYSSSSYAVYDATNSKSPLLVEANSPSNSLYVKSSGNVGIGTSAPGALLQVGTAGTSLGTMRLTGNTSGYVQIQPAAAAGSWNMTLPSSGGTNGQVLQTNGSGVTSWASVPTNGGTFLAGNGTQGAPSIAFQNDTDTGFWYDPASPNEIAVSTGGAARVYFTPTSLYTGVPIEGYLWDSTVYSPSSGSSPWPGGNSYYSLTNTNNVNGTFTAFASTARNASSVDQTSYIANIANSSGYAPTIAFGQQTGANSYSERMRIDASGNVGIGTTSPATTLDVNGAASVGSSIESASTYVNSTATYTIPNATVNIRRITLTANATITLPAFTTPAAKVWTLTVMVKQDGTGSRTLAWTPPGGDSILWDQSASAPAPASAASKISIYQFTKVSDETTWYATMVWKQN